MNIPNYQRAVEPTAAAAAHLGRATMKIQKGVGVVWDLVIQFEVLPEQLSGLVMPEPIAPMRAMVVAAANGGGPINGPKKTLDVAGKASLAWVVDSEVVRWQRDPFTAVVRWVAVKANEKRLLVEYCIRIVGRLGEHIEELFDSTLIVGFTPAQGELLAGPQPKAAETIPPEDDSEDDSEDDGEDSAVINYEAPNARSRRRR